MQDPNGGWTLIFICWIVALISTAGGLFFSEVMELAPCSLCWYQRIFMYPLVIIFIVGCFPLNKLVFKYSIPFIALGWLTALYHNFIQWGIIPESAAPCIEGVPCSATWINWFGFITIPLLSFLAFSFLFIIMIIFYRRYYQ